MGQDLGGDDPVFTPLKSTDPPGAWRRFIDGLRTAAGFKPVYLAERFAEAKLDTTDVDNQVELLKARQDYELVQARIRAMDAKTAAGLAGAKARIADHVARQVTAEGHGVNAATERLREAIKQIEMHGGYVEIALPELDEADTPESA